MLETREVRVLS